MVHRGRVDGPPREGRWSTEDSARVGSCGWRRHRLVCKSCDRSVGESNAACSLRDIHTFKQPVWMSQEGQSHA